MKKYMICFKAGLQETMEYRVDFMLNSISIVFVVAMQIFMWKTMYTGKSQLFSYTYIQMLMYTVFASLVSRVTMIDLGAAEIIKTGELSRYLIKPSNYFFQTVCNCTGRQCTTFVIIMVLLAMAISFFQFYTEIQITVLRCLLMILALFFGFFINVLLNFMISMAAFWFSEVGNLFSTVYIVQLLLSGGIFPLSIFGNVFKTISDLLPFSYTIQFPVNIITNKLSGSEIGRGIMMQIIWIGLSALAAYYLWKRGLRRYMAVGG
ncbi:MAG: hypothetical protein K0S47_4385 [Herbinix sp.]|jgi:ABC-2 type transport system permease protein|nr:hypothetical protein [Herbinix sp.]